MPNALQAFDYTAIPSDIAAEAHDASVRIKTRMARTAQDIIDIGQDLIAVKSSLPHGQFGSWIDAEFGMAERTARNMMAVSERFGKSATVADFTPSVLYALAAPSTPDEVVAEVTEAADRGETVTINTIKELKESLETSRETARKHKQERDVARVDAREAEKLRSGTIAEASNLRDELEMLKNNPPLISVDDQASIEQQVLMLEAAWSAADNAARTLFLERMANA